MELDPKEQYLVAYYRLISAGRGAGTISFLIAMTVVSAIAVILYFMTERQEWLIVALALLGARSCSSLIMYMRWTKVIAKLLEKYQKRITELEGSQK